MRLNLPILDQLKDSENILIAGAGGGFDVFAGLPIYFTLREMGKNVHLANYSFTSLDIVSHYCPTIDLRVNKLVGAKAGIPKRFQFGYYPEGFLSQWFKAERGEDVTVWMFAKVGPSILHDLYRKLIDLLKIDALILIDGGVDALMRGDETGVGTFLEDSVTLAAVKDIALPVKILACLGFGAELEVCHYNALENIAALTREGAFLGSCALTGRMPVYHLYEAASRYVWEQPSHRKSQINMRVVSSVRGAFGNYHMYNDYLPMQVFVSQFMSVYWFFQAQAVINRSLIIPAIQDSIIFEDAYAEAVALRQRLEAQSRPYRKFPY